MITNTQSGTNIQEIAAVVTIGQFADRAPRGLADGESLSLGRHTIRWFDTPHVPHGWDCGLMMDVTTRTFFCGDLFTQGGRGEKALTQTDILLACMHGSAWKGDGAGLLRELRGCLMPG